MQKDYDKRRPNASHIGMLMAHSRYDRVAYISLLHFMRHAFRLALRTQGEPAVPKATVIQFPPRPRQTFADLCAPSREDDEKLLRVIAAYEAEGGQVLFDEPADEPKPVEAPQPYVSEYLTRPLRTEDEARTQLNRPRIPKARGLLDLIAEQTGLDRNFAKLFGGGQ